MGMETQHEETIGKKPKVRLWDRHNALISAN
jgi:hypothetical protein